MQFFKIFLFGLFFSGMVACGGSSGGDTAPSSGNPPIQDENQAEYDGTDIASVTSGTDGRAVITDVSANTSYDIFILDAFDEPANDITVSFLKDGNNALIYILDPHGSYSDVVLIGTDSELSTVSGRSAFVVTNINLRVTMTAREPSTVGFVSGAYNLENVYLGATRSGDNWTTGCYTPSEIAHEMQSMYQPSMDNNSSILAFEGAGADSAAKYVKYPSSMLKNGILTALTSRIESVYGASSGSIDNEYFQLNCYSPSFHGLFGTICEIVRGASACESLNYTEISGAILADKVLSIDESPYLMTSDVSVAAGVTLTIPAGIIIKSKQNTKMKIAGDLIINGTETNPVFMTSANRNLQWGGIILTDSTNSVIEYAVIENAIQVVDLEGYSTPVVKNNLFRNNYTVFADAYVYQPMNNLKNNTFINNNSAFSGIRTHGISTIENNKFIDNNHIFKGAFFFGTLSVIGNSFEGTEQVIVGPIVGYGYGEVIMSGNWWGTTDISKINEMIYDRYDDATLREVPYNPIQDPSLLNAGSSIPVDIAIPIGY